MAFSKSIAKAIVGALTAGIGGLAIVITGNETFASVTVAEWLFVAAESLAVFGVVWAVPNKAME